MRILNLTILIAILSTSQLFAQDIWMHPNAGQWDDRIEYKVELTLGEMYIEKDGFTFYLHNAWQKLTHSHDEEGHEHSHDHAHQDHGGEYDAHVIKSKFVGSNWGGKAQHIDSSYFYRNYILGNDQSKWKSRLHSYNQLVLNDFYPGVDLSMDGRNAGLKYSLIVHPGSDPNQIAMEYTGQDGLNIDEEGNLRVANRFGEIIEGRPIAWTEGDKGKRKVAVDFRLEGNTVRFDLPDGYDFTQTLVIDPDLTFSTFSGSTADNWGFTAAPDVAGNLFGGGVVFGPGYPISPGAYNPSFTGGTIDLGISKFNVDGTQMIYSTYIGGNGSESPNSIVSSQNGELFIFGLTSSTDFPMAGSPFDNTFNGGPGIPNAESNNLGFTGGVDLYVARLNSNGTSLLASTYIGGSGTDGLNTSLLRYNYGDQFRGEIILDESNNVYVASMTTSSDFPVVLGSQPALSGSQDAVIFKMPPTLNTLSWSTYFGGSGLETGNALQIASNGDLFVAGGTASPSLPISSGHDLSFNGGSCDGYVARFNSINGSILSGTYMGLNEYDQTYFVQLDIDDNVYVLGQSESDWGVDAGHYGVANSGQFIRKYNTNLTNVEWTTMIGAGTGNVELSPTAFLVSDCYDIYLSGWGGVLNTTGQATNSTTNGFPVTIDAFQAQTNGSNFWIAVLDQDATTLKYATYMGGVSSSNNHVDGGTSRFDKSGRIYHAVCGACGGVPNGFTTTPGVWSPQNPSSNCNLAAFKFELSTIEAVVSNPNPLVCIPDPVIFNNNSSNGNAFHWDFGDNTTSTDINPVHYYSQPGDYTVTLVVSDTNGCFSPDSITFVVHIGSFEGGIVQPPGPICPGESFQFEAFGGTVYEWSPAQYLDDPTIPNPTATVNQTTDFTVIISDTCGVDTAYVTLNVFGGNVNASNDTSICIGNSVDLFASGGGTYQWSPPDFLDDPTSATPLCTPTASTTYVVEVTTVDNCILHDTVQVDVYYTPPIPILEDTVNLCEGSSVQITADGGVTYLWYPNINITPVTGPVVTVNPTSDMMYYCDFTNACGTVTDSVFVDIQQANIHARNDTIICPGESATLIASGGVSYTWSPAATLNNPYSSLVYASPVDPTTYYVVGIDQYGCTAMDSVFVDLFPRAFIQTVPDVHAFLGDVVQLGATSTTPGPYVWSPAEFLSCIVCEEPTAQPDQNYTYTVTYTDHNGCTASDNVTIFYDPILWVPNTFTPNGEDAVNPVFQAIGGNIQTFKMEIYNRWGELIVTLNDLSESWDGTYEKSPEICQDGTYTWKAIITDLEGVEQVFVGHINLLR